VDAIPHVPLGGIILLGAVVVAIGMWAARTIRTRNSGVVTAANADLLMRVRMDAFRRAADLAASRRIGGVFVDDDAMHLVLTEYAARVRVVAEGWIAADPKQTWEADRFFALVHGDNDLWRDFVRKLDALGATPPPVDRTADENPPLA